MNYTCACVGRFLRVASSDGKQKFILSFLLTNSIIFRLLGFCLVINLISRSFHNLQAHRHHERKVAQKTRRYFIYLRYLAVKHINK